MSYSVDELSKNFYAIDTDNVIINIKEKHLESFVRISIGKEVIPVCYNYLCV